ncbi:hypothetical protein, conserved [Trypanosoma brucei brucei TREU927]|uniref:Uncharacterized protein n=1 Tax=Trypanosoma brucei brucei (strain 927/4 GUTat10.1) TaxID=185431 RepID=Q38G17_TRYB2|nr:hypothetical protein, conserved [Trypanosoma brucei brucei TREU927]EAN76253.1 hypothetical protein, conserved [Trypanosoma brucei brucei TREU927]
MGISFCVSLHSLFEDDLISLEVVENKYMQFVSKDMRNICKTENYLVVAGIPSLDNDERFRRRNLQRDTCWSYPEVGRNSNNFSVKLLIIYVISPHINYNCELREIVGEEDI